jgi:hypothetical protein
MTILEKTVSVNKNIDEVFDLLYEDKNVGIFNEHMRLIEFEKQDWVVKRKLKVRKEIIYVHIPEIPDEVVNYLSEKDKFLRIQVKNKIVTQTPTHQKIKTKFKILNVNPFFKTIINDLHIVDLKNTIILDAKNADKTDVKIKIKVSLNIPRTKKINEFISDIVNKLMNSALALVS